MRPLPESFAGPRVVIERWSTTDTAALATLVEASLDHLRPWMAWATSEPLSHPERIRLIARWDRYWASGAGAVYGVFENGAAVGGCGLHRRVGPGSIDLGYWLGQSHTGRGLAAETAKVLTTGAFTLDDIESVQIHHQTANVASGAIAEALGYEHLGDEQHGAIVVRRWRMDRARWRPG